MAETIIGQQLPPPGPYPTLPFSAGQNNIVYNGGTVSFSVPVVEAKTLILAKNTDSASHTISMTSVPDQYNRTGDILDTMSAGAEAFYGPFRQGGWTSGGNLAVTVSNTAVNVAVLTLP